MLDWDTIYPKLREWVAAGTGIPLAQCFVENEDRTYQGTRYATIEVVSEDAVSTDEHSIETIDTVLRKVISGHRTFVLRVRTWGIEQKQGHHADLPLGRLRSYFRLPELKAILSPVKVACVGMGPADASDVDEDGHMRSQWLSDLDFNAAFRHVVSVEVSAPSVIETVNGTSEVPTGSDPEPFAVP